MSLACGTCKKEFEYKKNLDYHTEKKVCEDKNHKCKYCNNVFSSRNSMYKHISNHCKVRNNIPKKEDKEIVPEEIMNNIGAIAKDAIAKEEIINNIGTMAKNATKEELIKILEKMGEKYIRCEDENDNLIVSNQGNTTNNVAINNSTNTNNITNITNTNNNINNGIVVNNTYNLVGYGKEDLSKIDREDFLKVLQVGGFDTALKLTEMIHFNPKYPEFHNIYIPSAKDKYAVMFDGTFWRSRDKTDFAKDIYDDKKNYIEINVDEYMDELKPSRKNAFKRWLETDETDPRIRKIMEDIKMLMHDKKRFAMAAKKEFEKQKAQQAKLK